MIIPDRVTQRVLSNYQVSSDGCHVSNYSVGSHGYAQVGWTDVDGADVVTLCHRVVWVSANGPIPDGLTVDHICKGKKCINVDHLRLLTNFENARRTGGRDWPLGQCINGHDNSHLYAEPSGRIRCRECKREAWQANGKHRRRERMAARQSAA